MCESGINIGVSESSSSGSIVADQQAYAIGATLPIGNTLQYGDYCDNGHSPYISDAAGWSAWQQASAGISGGRLLSRDNIELRLIDGRKVVRRAGSDSIIRLGEVEQKRLCLARKFPFFRFESRRVTRVVYADSHGCEAYDVDCNLRTFLKLAGIECRSWSETVLTEEVLNGNDTRTEDM